MKSLLLFLLLALSPVIISTVDASPRRSMAMAGGWTPIKDTSDPHVVELAKFAVSEHNKEANSKLAFSRVTKGESQVVSGVNYKLVVAVEGGGSYEAIVWEKEWLGFRKLTSFKLLA